jgi:predicted RNase H-like HicB family nuclease
MVKKKTDINKQVEYYMSLPYTLMVKYRPEQGGYYVASYVELPYLTMTGATPEEAVKELLIEKPEWFESNIEDGIPIPEPVEPQKFSGKIVLRMSPSMHSSLIRIAELEGVSLNQYMIAALARALGFKEGQEFQAVCK